jgi:hypothetical protein
LALDLGLDEVLLGNLLDMLKLVGLESLLRGGS